MSAQQLDPDVVDVAVGGQKITIGSEGTVGGWSVHRIINDKVAKGPGYAVTHRATGLRVWTTESFDTALRVAQFLDRSKMIPDDPAEVYRWKDELTPVGRAEIILRLTEIAPRYLP